MPRTEHDLPLTAYALIGLVFVGQEVLGLATALMLAVAFVGVLIAMSLLSALVSCLAQSDWSGLHPRKWMGPHR